MDAEFEGSAPMASRRGWRHGLVLATLALLVIASLSFVTSVARAGGGGGDGCHGPANITGLWCSGDFTTSAWNSDWSNVNINTAPCYTQVANSYSDSATNGVFEVLEKARADESSSCPTNIGELQINPGTHGGSFTAWKSGSAYYTVVANFTFEDDIQPGTYCASTSQEYTTGQVTGGDAMYDQTTGAGVGYSTNNPGDNVSIANTCNYALNGEDSGSSVSVSFMTSTTINQGDVLTPRASVVAEVFVSQPGISPYYSAHCYATLDFDNDGYGYITLNSIWVH